jgi:hypothetical protein
MLTRFNDRSMSRFQTYLHRQILKKFLIRRCCTINIHYLGHIAYIIRQLGPMPSYSCRPLERTIGQFKNRPLSKQSPGTSYRK